MDPEPEVYRSRIRIRKTWERRNMTGESSDQIKYVQLKWISQIWCEKMRMRKEIMGMYAYKTEGKNRGD